MLNILKLFLINLIEMKWLIENMKKVRRSRSMPKIRVYANYEFTNDSDNCNDNGKLSMLYEVPKS